MDQIIFLGHVISNKDISVDPAKVEAVMKWEILRTALEIRSFLGLTGYYRRFIEGFSSIAALMTKLLRKGVKFLWTEECDYSFRTLK